MISVVLLLHPLTRVIRLWLRGVTLLRVLRQAILARRKAGAILSTGASNVRASIIDNYTDTDSTDKKSIKVRFGQAAGNRTGVYSLKVDKQLRTVPRVVYYRNPYLTPSCWLFEESHPKRSESEREERKEGFLSVTFQKVTRDVTCR